MVTKLLQIEGWMTHPINDLVLVFVKLGFLEIFIRAVLVACVTSCNLLVDAQMIWTRFDTSLLKFYSFAPKVYFI